MEQVVRLGVDLAKRVIQLHGVGRREQVVLRRAVSTDRFAEFMVNVLGEYGITSSMSRKGNCWDYACSDTLFGSLKVERLHGQRFKTRREAKDETVAWLLWYNCTRLHSTLA